MYKKLRLFLAVIGLGLALAVPARALAATNYGDGDYNGCTYNSACSTAAVAPVSAQPVPTVTLNVNGSGNIVQATDADGNLANGYEQFFDGGTGIKSLALIRDANGISTYILDANKDGKPDLYWNPSAAYSAPVTVEKDAKGEAWVYVDAQNQKQRYYVNGASTTSASASSKQAGGSVAGQPSTLSRVGSVLVYAVPLLTVVLLLIWLVLRRQRRKNVQIPTSYIVGGGTQPPGV